MKKFFIFGFTLFICIQSNIFSQTINYWKMNVMVNDNQGNSVQQTAYFFRDLNSMNALTGFPNGDFQTAYNWVQPLSNIPSYFFEIYATMKKENFQAAFVQWGAGTNFHGEPYWMYHVFLIWNGITYYDGISRTNNPVIF